MSSGQVQGLVNKGIIEINPRPAGGEATYAIVGLPRSGTSMLSSLMQTLGVFMGNAVDKAVYEDVEVAKFIDENDYEGLKTFIAKRNATHPTWGFKRPSAYKNLPQLTPLMRNPRVLVIFRDVLAIAMRNHVSMQMDVISLLPRYVSEYQDLVRTIGDLNCPLLLVSYEKFIQFPEESIAKTAEFVGISLTPELQEKALAVVKNGPEAYLQSSRLRYSGHVDRIVDGRLRGWAMVVDQPNVKAKVNLLVDGRSVATAVANRLRKDLEAAGMGDGHHGFEISLGAGVRPDSTIEVTAGNAGFKLPNSGKRAANYGLS